jgi:Spy/CpxP family protein refolding chaperone
MRMWMMAMAAAVLAAGARAGDDRPMRPPEGGPGGKMARWLDLTPDQSAKIKDLMAAHRKATRGLRDRRQDAMRALRYAMEDKAPESQITAKLNDLKAAQEALRAAQDKHHDEIAKLLTPTQRAKFILGRDRMPRHGMKPDKPGRGPRPGRREGPRHVDGDDD